MKKIPTLFKRVFTADHKKTITEEVTPGCECVLRGECIATVKWDGACCAIINGEIYKRYDAKIGKDGKRKSPPVGAIPCEPEPDPITGHWPHWVKCDKEKPEDKYFLEALDFKDNPLFINPAQYYTQNMSEGWDLNVLPDGTYEAIGVAWQGNPYNLQTNRLIRHGGDLIPIQNLWDTELPIWQMSFKSIARYLSKMEMEGIVFWKNGEPVCKIKRSDFGFPWPIKKGVN